MKLFSTLFELVKLPIVIVKDTVTAIPDMASLNEPFSDTRRQCEKIDEEVSR